MIPAWFSWGALKTSKFWLKALPYAAGVAVLIGIYLWIDNRGYQRGFHARDAEVKALRGTIENLKEASAKAKAENHAYVVRVNNLQDQITKEKENDYPRQLADARSALAAYVRMHPAPHQGDPRSDRTPGVPVTPAEPDAHRAEAIVSVADLDACAQSYVTAVGLQDWIRAQQAIPR